MKVKKLAEILDKSEEETSDALDILEQKLENRGIRLLKKDGRVMLSTAPEAAKVCEEISKEEFNKDIGKAGVETLSIIIYRGPISRPEIDYIRGVNSSFTLRNLIVRGLAERKTNPKDSRSFLYSPSFKLLQYLGVNNINKLPQYELFKKTIDEFVKNKDGR